jgi:hypothetical protein
MSTEPSVEILQYDLDYSFLGVEMASTSLANFSTIITKIRDTFPQAVFDDRLIEPFAVDILFTAPRDNIEINCKLIYLYHQAISGLGSSV